MADYHAFETLELALAAAQEKGVSIRFTADGFFGVAHPNGTYEDHGKATGPPITPTGNGSIFQQQKSESMHNFGSDKHTILAKESMACDGECSRLSDHLNKPIDVEYFYAHSVTLENEKTGEINDAVRVVLFDQSGGAFAAVSEGVFKSLARIVEVFGHEKWDPPVKVEAIQRNVKGGKRFMTLKPILDGTE